ncbi:MULTISPECIES: PKD domain-containing protein [unclassified Methanoregula]|uniref:PKD domain-containing protein n=1 Tax=unclassified Methanoregula TaxID=2649730 RepID=UPI0009D29449|nr:MULTISPECIES: PKD domain-containing protein [unclassified Methanoregula]OPX64950.1 MAG: PKD domain protein [Methanoregula sp. PtaB.Bin085]OPY33002.1 MAG: PKD domain protein [Methanoregula sp. PtaU1.Bin006]
MNDRSKRDAGLSDALGAVILISVVALGITVASVAILSSPVPQKVPAISVDVFNTSDTVFLRHSGGDTLARGEYRILADDIDRTSEFLMQGIQPSRWSLGDTLEYHVASPNDIPGSIQIIAFNGRSEQVILQVHLLPPTLAPTHTVTPTGTATTSPTATTSTTTTLPAPSAGFSGIPLSGTRPLTVQFTDMSTGSPTSWSWDFGDGGSSSLQNPSHVYLTTGTYTVTLTATNAGGSDTETKTGYITVTDAAPVAEFNGTPRSGTRPLTVQFTDMSTGSPTSWSWNFGDGGTSTVRNASHTYTAAGNYTVSLTATNAWGSDTEMKVGYINVTSPVTTTTTTPVPVHQVTLNTDRQGDLVEGTYMQFRVTGLYSSIRHGSTTYNLNPGDTVRLTVGNDGKGLLYATSTQISTFDFNGVRLSINGVDYGTANLNSIWISGFDSYVSTLTVDVPSHSAWTQLVVDGTTIISGTNSSHIVVVGLTPLSSGGTMNLDTTSGRVYYVGGAASYSIT